MSTHTSSSLTAALCDCSNPIKAVDGTTEGYYNSHAEAWDNAVHRWSGEALPFSSFSAFSHANNCLNNLAVHQVSNAPQYYYDIWVCPKLTSSPSCCPNTVRFVNGCNASTFPVGKKFVKPTDCTITDYTLLQGINPATQSSLVGFPLIYQVVSNSPCHKFDIFNPWGFTNITPSSLAANLTDCLLPMTHFNPSRVPPPPTSSPSGSVSDFTFTGACHPSCDSEYKLHGWCKPWSNNCTTTFIPGDRDSGLPLYILARNGVLAQSCLTPWERTFLEDIPGTHLGGVLNYNIPYRHTPDQLVGWDTRTHPYFHACIDPPDNPYHNRNFGHNVPCWLLDTLRAYQASLTSAGIPIHSWPDFKASLVRDPMFNARTTTYGRVPSPRLIPTTNSSISWPRRLWFDPETGVFSCPVRGGLEISNCGLNNPIASHWAFPFPRCSASYGSSDVAKIYCGFHADPKGGPGNFNKEILTPIRYEHHFMIDPLKNSTGFSVWTHLFRFGEKAIGFNPAAGIYGWMQIQVCAHCDKDPDWKEGVEDGTNWSYGGWFIGEIHPLNLCDMPFCGGWATPPSWFPSGVNPCRPPCWPNNWIGPFAFLGRHLPTSHPFTFWPWHYLPTPQPNRYPVRRLNWGGLDTGLRCRGGAALLDIKPNVAVAGTKTGGYACGDRLKWIPPAPITAIQDFCPCWSKDVITFVATDVCPIGAKAPQGSCVAQDCAVHDNPSAVMNPVAPPGASPTPSSHTTLLCWRLLLPHISTQENRPGTQIGSSYWQKVECCSSVSYCPIVPDYRVYQQNTNEYDHGTPGWLPADFSNFVYNNNCNKCYSSQSCLFDTKRPAPSVTAILTPGKYCYWQEFEVVEFWSAPVGKRKECLCIPNVTCAAYKADAHFHNLSVWTHGGQYSCNQIVKTPIGGTP
jgi:hypothetical protein